MNGFHRTARLSRLLACMAAACSTAAVRAVPVSVSVEGLPPGLTVRADVERNVCPDGVGWAGNPSQPMSEQTSVEYETFTSSTGQAVMRPKLVTRYVASFDTQTTPAPNPQKWDIRCSAVGMDTDRFKFGVSVSGLNLLGGRTLISGIFAETAQTAVSVSAKLAARTTALTTDGPVWTRNLRHGVNMSYSASLGSVGAQRLELLRPRADGTLDLVASIYVDKERRTCLRAGSSLQCSDIASVEAAGVRAYPVALGTTTWRRTEFVVALLPDFAPGPLKLRGSADATDLARYFVDGTPLELDLLPWQPSVLDLTVQ